MSPLLPPAVASAPSHYENFPVASWLCPPRLRPPIAAIYAFARTADDIADEGDATPGQRLADLQAMRQDLAAIAGGDAPSVRWPHVFGPLAHAMRQFALPEPLLADLLSAFAQDVEKTRDGGAYADCDELLDYCRRSANPIGRLLLHLDGVNDADSLAMSDAICSALQLVNFWQDLTVDLPRGRFYLPLTGVSTNLFNAGSTWATNLGLYHFTTTTNQVKEGTTKADTVKKFIQYMLSPAGQVHSARMAAYPGFAITKGGRKALNEADAKEAQRTGQVDGAANDPVTLIKDGRIHYRNIPVQQSLEDWNDFWQEYKNAS